jgi:hypothetical protein
MRRLAAWSIAACIVLAACGNASGEETGLSVAQIADKNAEARGGLEAWRKVQTMVLSGHVESATAPASFMLALKRPGKTRFEIVAAKQMSLRVFDGRRGWKLHAAGGGGQPSLQPYSQEELQFAHDEPVIDGPLIDYQARGVTIALAGMDELDGRSCYRLDLHLPSGAHRQLWLDAQTFLDVRYDREARNALGQVVMVSVRYRDYQPIEGLQIARTIEAGAAMGAQLDRLVIDKVVLNPPLADWMFVKPGTRRTNAAVPVLPERRMADGTDAPGLWP